MPNATAKRQLDDKLLVETVHAAVTEVTAAESSLEQLLSELRVRPRPEKVTITNVVETAFTRLRTARSELVKLQELVDSKKKKKKKK